MTEEPKRGSLMHNRVLPRSWELCGGPGDVVVMDNLSPHKAAGIKEAIEAVGAMVLYLPRYSADFNPIEYLWSKVKGYLRSLNARTFDALCGGLAAAINTVTPPD